jgi:hypothetical protein
VAISLIVSGCSSRRSTPEKTASLFKRAMASGDWDTAFSCLTTGSQGTLIGGLYLEAAYRTVGNQEHGTSLAALAEKHELNELRDQTVDSARLALIFRDLIAWMEVASPEILQRLAESATATEYAEFEIDGDRATAKTTIDGNTVRDTSFVTVNEEWLIN